MTIGIGTTLYFFDINRRVYPPTKPGELYAGGGPIWREHWRPMKIVGETSRSWVLEYNHGKIPKKGPLLDCWAVDAADIDRRAWMHDNAHKIADRIHRLTFDQLAAVATAIKYQHEPPKD